MRNFGLVLLFLQLRAARNPHEDLGEVRAPSPCSCSEGICRCCIEFMVIQFFSNTKQKGCVNVMYDPDEFAFTTSVTLNNRELYKNHFTGKNPDPVCVFVPRTNLRFCTVFSNVYFAGRNLHMCIDVESHWHNTKLFGASLDCIRVGANGMAVLKPEDGGGLPANIFSPGNEDEDYDDIL